MLNLIETFVLLDAGQVAVQLIPNYCNKNRGGIVWDASTYSTNISKNDKAQKGGAAAPSSVGGKPGCVTDALLELTTAQLHRPAQ
jgi:hypothetical protein